MILMETKTIIFDLDDTLYKEIDYLKSAFKEIANFVEPNSDFLNQKMIQLYENKENVFDWIVQNYQNISSHDLKKIYRNHLPSINFEPESKKILLELKNRNFRLGLITDGYSITQKNKLKALELETVFDLIIISEEIGTEKPHEKNFTIFHQFKTSKYYYIADNFKKDFVTPNALGWNTIALLDNGKNIHKQDFLLQNIYLPQFRINNLKEILKIIE